ncbi:MAG: FAD-dependent oxidoreductase [Erysipelotrichales bacterium]|nr:FAD-dependent oxidoreductase [Erysipelotrichales bacterium]
MKKSYLEEYECGFTPLTVIHEASRCLLCHDAPCSKACPAGTDPAKFIRSVRFRNFKGAAETIRENNVLGSICARVCPTEKLCQLGCSRSGIDRPIEIGRIQRYVTDFESSIGMEILEKGMKNLGKVAIVGSGPAGLQAAATLTKLGYDVTVFEKNEKLGGYLRYGIPEYRLPSEIVDLEIKRIQDLGVTFITNKEITNLEELKKDYKAILLAVGASYGRTLPLFANNENVELAVDVLAKIKDNQGKVEVPDNVLIIGGGDVAMDVGTSLKLLGCKDVTVVAREQTFEFPASKKEYKDAHDNDVSIIDGYTPESINGNEVTFKHVKLDAILRVKADKIILAIGQMSKLEMFDKITSNRGIVDVKNYQTSDEKIFAAGDIINGDKLVVAAVKYGKEAAYAIHEYLGGKR